MNRKNRTGLPRRAASVFAQLMLGALLALAAGCDNEGPAEQAGEKIDNAAEDTADAIDDAADEVADKADDTADEVEDALDEATQ